MAETWTLIGLLAATLGTLVAALFHLGSRIDAQGRDLRSAIEGLAGDLRAEIHEGDAALRRELNEQIGGLRAELSEQVGGLRRAIDAQTQRIDALSARMDAHLERHAG